MDTKKKFSQYSKSNQAFYIFNAVFWIIVMFLILYPLYLVIKFLGENPGACPWDEAKKYFSKSLMSISSEYILQI